ncbi:hypothetical protein JYU34_016614 [Plutella xylostella]|uniref:Secreted protein n=1 Tax=Plutella xylostella TaxID=51655 RepID=A0ABQ7Q319_PLUXY|nr:hypothetical protein JYU34_016614 [Plutella xylostella]
MRLRQRKSRAALTVTLAAACGRERGVLSTRRRLESNPFTSDVTGSRRVPGASEERPVEPASCGSSGRPRLFSSPSA